LVTKLNVAKTDVKKEMPKVKSDLENVFGGEELYNEIAELFASLSKFIEEELSKFFEEATEEGDDTEQGDEEKTTAQHTYVYNDLAQKQLLQLKDIANNGLNVDEFYAKYKKYIDQAIKLIKELGQKELAQAVEEPNLKYYHRYERHHGQKINPHVPLQRHYSNERKNRRAADHIKDQIQRTVEQAGFQVRQLKHSVVKMENNVNRDRATRDGVLRMADQRENSIKFEINHEEKFKELYEQRLKKNQRREGTALPDQRFALEKLVKFDEGRVAHWKKAEDGQQRLLQHTVQRDVEESIKSERTVAELQARIGMLKAQLDGMKQRAAFRVARLSEKLMNLNKVIAQDIALDHKRASNEKKEATLANSSKVVAESAL